MADALTEPLESLSSWWKIAAIVTMAAGFAVLILLTVKAYQNAPPIPDKVVDPNAAISAPIFLRSPCTSWPSILAIASLASVSVAATLT
jgi:hypothetical protein